MKNIFFCFLIFLLSGNVFSQEENPIQLPQGLGISNQLKYSNDLDVKREIFENWLNLDYNYGNFTTGFRLEVFQPNDPNPAVSRGKQRFADIAYKYLTIEFGESTERASLTAGNFYALFGRGLVLKIYEDRNVRIDNNLLGVKISGEYKGLHFTALSGMPENADTRRTDIIHAIDFEYRGLQFLRSGISFASNQPELEGIARTQLLSARVSSSIEFADIYSEFGIKKNRDITGRIFGGNELIAGKAFYSALNFYYNSFSLAGEYKLYDNFGFTSYDGTVYYNTPPSVRKDYTYILLNRHPSPLNQDNEEGFQAEFTYNYSDESSLLINYGLTKSLSSGSYYQRILNLKQERRTQLKEFFGQINHYFSNSFAGILAVGYNEELATNTKNFTPIAELRYYFDEINTLRFVVEHQQTSDNLTKEEYYTDIFAVEYLRSPALSLSFLTEMQTNEPDAGRVVRKFWNLIQIGYKIGNHSDISLLIGKRQAGNICIGGVCRYEPAFSGIEIKMLSRF